MKISSTEIQNNFGKYLKIASELEIVTITRNGKDIARLSPCLDLECHLAEEAFAYKSNINDPVSYERFIEMTENSDLRYELIDGVVYNLSAPNFYHQTALAEIFVYFYNWFKGKKCRPLMAPFDVTLLKSEENINVVQPDIIIICDTEMIDEKGKYKGVPTLTVEILSSSTRTHDLLRKLELYRSTGIIEYWVVDPDKKQISIYNFDFEKKSISDYRTYIGDSVVKSEVFKDMELNLQDMFPY